MFSLNELKQEWRAVIITLLSVAGVIVFAGIAGVLFFDLDTAIVAIPPLTGGGIATILMSDAAAAAGMAELAMLASIIYIMQGFVGFPLTSFMLRRAGQKLLTGFRSGDMLLAGNAKENKPKQVEKKTRKTFNDMVPEKYKVPSYYLAKLALLALLAIFLESVTGLNSSLTMIIVGVLAAHFGILEKDPLKKANSFGILMLCLTASFMRYFADASPQQVFSLILPVVVFLLFASIGIAVFSIPLGKKFGYPIELSVAIGLNCFLGFPYNFVITNEVISSLAENQEESDYLDGILMPKMIIGSMVAVSMVSALIASILVPFLAA